MFNTMRRSQRGFIGTLFGIWGAVVLVLAIGWIANLVQVVKLASANVPIAEQTTMFFVKAVCILIAPAGAVLGWIGIFS